MQEPTPIARNDTGLGWHLAPPRRHLQRALVGLAVLVLAGSALSAARDGELVVAAVLGAVVVGVVAIVVEPRTPRPPRLPHSPTGGLLLPTHSVKISAIVMMAFVGLVLCVLPTALVVGGRGDASVVGRVVTVVLCLAFGALFVAGAVGGVTSRRLPDRGILLTVDGVVLQTQRPSASFAWDRCGEVRAHWTRRRSARDLFLSPEDPIANWLTFAVPPQEVQGRAPLRAAARTEEPTVDVAHLALDPFVALEVCRFYLAEPASRAELRTSAALDRVAAVERALSARR